MHYEIWDRSHGTPPGQTPASPGHTPLVPPRGAECILLECFLVITSFQKNKKLCSTRKHSRRMRTDCAVTRMTSDWVAMRPIVDRMTDTCLWKHCFPLRLLMHSSRMRTNYFHGRHYMSVLGVYDVTLRLVPCSFLGGVWCLFLSEPMFLRGVSLQRADLPPPPHPTPPPPWTDRGFLKHYLPLRSVTSLSQDSNSHTTTPTW